MKTKIISILLAGLALITPLQSSEDPVSYGLAEDEAYVASRMTPDAAGFIRLPELHAKHIFMSKEALEALDIEGQSVQELYAHPYLQHEIITAGYTLDRLLSTDEAVVKQQIRDEINQVLQTYSQRHAGLRTFLLLDVTIARMSVAAEGDEFENVLKLESAKWCHRYPTLKSAMDNEGPSNPSALHHIIAHYIASGALSFHTLPRVGAPADDNASYQHTACKADRSATKKQLERIRALMCDTERDCADYAGATPLKYLRTRLIEYNKREPYCEIEFDPYE